MSTSIHILPIFVASAVLVVMLVLIATIQLLVKLGEIRKGPSGTESDENPELVAVLTAAATAAVGQPVLVHRVQMHRDAVHPRWAQAGRMDIMLSHRVEPRR